MKKNVNTVVLQDWKLIRGFHQTNTMKKRQDFGVRRPDAALLSFSLE